MSQKIIIPLFRLNLLLMAPLQKQRRQHQLMLAEQGIAVDLLPRLFGERSSDGMLFSTMEVVGKNGSTRLISKKLVFAMPLQMLLSGPVGGIGWQHNPLVSHSAKEANINYTTI